MSVALAASMVPAAVPLTASTTSAASSEPPLFTFVSMPDFLNADIGDTRSRRGQGWDPGDPNSTNASWQRAVDVILDEIQAEGPRFVAVAGDQVNGHWGVDPDRTGIFGPVGTTARRLRAVTNAGNLYHQQWRRRFDQRGLTVYPALGDHEIGDNPWPAGSFALRAVPTYKRVWARQHTTFSGSGHRFASRPTGTAFEDTAYAVRVANTLFVTVDVFRRTASGVRVTVSGGQLDWLNRRLARARASGVEHIVVQGHTPVLGPVRRRHSSNLHLAGREGSAFWKTLKRHRVDLYLCGEVHDMTTLTDGVVQVAHGALASWGEENYLLGRVFRDRIELELRQFTGAVTDARALWQVSRRQRPHRGVAFQPGTTVVGTLTLDKSTGSTVLRDRTGYFLEGM